MMRTVVPIRAATPPSRSQKSVSRQMSKVKTGCLTCKRRRVKCDETRPACQRCRKAGKECSGYPMGIKKAVPPPILPRSSSLSIYCPTTRIQASQEGLQYFGLYQHHAAAELAGYYQADFWTHVVLQESQEFEFVKHAVIAVGALYKSLEIAQTVSPTTSGASQAHHKEFALRQYQKSICSLRRALENGSVPLRTTLVSCLLLVCFESFQGNHEMATKQLASGLRLLDHQLPREDCMPTGALGKSTSPEVNSIEVDIAPIFARLTVQLSSFHDLEVQNMLKECEKELLVSMKAYKKVARTPFETAHEARYALDILMPRMVRYYHYASIFRYGDPHDIPKSMRQWLRENLKVLQRWNIAFWSLYSRISSTMQGTHHNSPDNSTPNQRTLASITILKIHSVVCFILLQTSLSISELAFDAFHAEFHSALTHARLLLNYRSMPTLLGTRPFTFDTTSSMPLLIVAQKCRDRILRREAIELLNRAQRREGVWDGPLAAKVAGWIMAVEEEGMVPFNCDSHVKDVVPEEKRVLLLGVVVDWKKRCASVKCGRRVRGKDEPVDVRETTIAWGENIGAGEERVAGGLGSSNTEEGSGNVGYEGFSYDGALLPLAAVRESGQEVI